MNNNLDEIRKDFVAQNTAAVQSNDETSERARLSAIHGADNVWNTDQVRALFEVQSFAAPFCIVKRKSDGAKGAIEFQHSPRLYFTFSKL